MKRSAFGTNLAAVAYIDDDGSIKGPLLFCTGHARLCAARDRRRAGWNQSNIATDTLRTVIRADVLEIVDLFRSRCEDGWACATCAIERGDKKLLDIRVLVPPLALADLGAPVDAVAG
jgi:hypothetical protein